MFIDVKNGKEQLKGTSYYNAEEAKVITKLKDFCLDQFKRIPQCKFTKDSIYVITPYNAQVNMIAENFSKDGTEDQVLSIDSSQGREFELVFVSMVRTSPGSFIKEYNRINVGITRAQHGLVIVGNARILMREPKWKKLLTKNRNNIVQGLEGAKDWVSRGLQAAYYPKSVP